MALKPGRPAARTNPGTERSRRIHERRFTAPVEVPQSSTERATATTVIAKHPRFVLYFTPTSASWLNAVEGFFANLAKKRLKRGVFRSLQELKDAIHRFLHDTNANPKPFTWTKDPNKIIAAVKRGHQVLNSIH